MKKGKREGESRRDCVLDLPCTSVLKEEGWWTAPQNSSLSETGEEGGREELKRWRAPWGRNVNVTNRK